MTLRIALVAGRDSEQAGSLAAELAGSGQVSVCFIEPRGVAWLDRIMARRGYTAPLSHYPAAMLRLQRAHCDLVHVMSAEHAAPALWWARRTRCPVLLELVDPPQRNHLANGRLRMQMLTRALRDSHAIIARDQATADAARRWLSVEPSVVSDAAALFERYESLTA